LSQVAGDIVGLMEGLGIDRIRMTQEHAGGQRQEGSKHAGRKTGCDEFWAAFFARLKAILLC